MAATVRRSLNPAVLRLHRQWGVLVKQRRKALGLGQVDLAQLTGIDQGSISRIERGELGKISDRNRIALAHALGVRVDDLFPYPSPRPNGNAS
jgi:transcriptional regulator with XRE-family HTH domain